MPINTNLRKFELRNQYRNGNLFVGATSEFATNFAATVGEQVQATYQVDLSWYASASTLESWQISAGVIERAGGSFFDDGFAVGQSFEFFPDYSLVSTASSEFTATVDAILSNGQRLEFTVTAGSQSTTGSNSAAGILAEADSAAGAPPSAILRFNILPNGSNFSNISEVSNNAQAWYIAAIDLAGGTVSSMQPVNAEQGWLTGSATIRRSAFNLTKNGVTYEIIHTFRVVPFYVLGYLSSLQNGTVPNLWQQELNYFFELEFRDGIANTGSAKIARPALPLGTSAWFDQSVGGFYSRYNVFDLAYTDTATSDAVTALQLSKRTTVEFKVSRLGVVGSSAGFNAGEKVIVYIAYLPGNQSEYQQTPTDLSENFLVDQLAHIEGTAATVGTGIIKRVEVTLSSSVFTVQADIEYNAAEQIKIGADGNYLIWCQVADVTLGINSTDRSALIVDTDEYIAEEFIAGLATFPKFNILPHQRTLGADTGISPAETLNAWNEDGLVVDYTLQLDTGSDAVLTGLTFILAAYKDADETYFELDRYEIDLSGGVVSGGIQQFSVNTTRGYVLLAGDQFNLVDLDTGSAGAGTQDYEGATAQKIKWQDWTFNADADPIFYDAAEPNNNLNFYSENYSGVNGYTIRIIAVAETTGNDANGVLGVGRDIAVSGELNMFDYGVSDGNWTGIISTHDPDTLADLGGAILSNKNTLFRTTWNDADDTDISNVYGIHRLQNTGSPGDDIEEISSLYLPPAQRLNPKPGQTRLEVYVSGTDIITECLIDHTRLSGGPLNLSARIGRFSLEPQFTVSYTGCAMRLSEIYPNAFTNIEYQFTVDGVIVETVNTTSSVYDWSGSPFFAGQTVDVQQTITTGGGGTIITEENTSVPSLQSDCVMLEWTTLNAAPIWQIAFDAIGRSCRVWDGVTMQNVSPSSTAPANVTHSGLTPPQSIQTITTASWVRELIFRYNNPPITSYQTGAIDLSALTQLRNFDASGVVGSATNNFNSITFPVHAQPWEGIIVTAFAGASLDISDITVFASGATIDINFSENVFTTLTTPASTTGALARWNSQVLKGVTMLDLRGYTFSNARLSVNDMTALTTLQLRASGGGTLNQVVFDDTTSLGSLDLSGYTLSGASVLGDRTAAATVTFGTQAGVITSFNLSGCPNLNNLVLTNVTGIQGQFNVQANPALTTINLPTSSGTISTLRFERSSFGYASITALTLTTSGLTVDLKDMSLAAADVNSYLIDLDSMLGAGTGTIDIAGTGGTANAAPTGAGLTAASNLVTKGYTVITN